MRIRLLANSASPHGVYQAGAIVDWPDEWARPLIESGAAIEVDESVREAESATLDAAREHTAERLGPLPAKRKLGHGTQR